MKLNDSSNLKPSFSCNQEDAFSTSTPVFLELLQTTQSHPLWFHKFTSAAFNDRLLEKFSSKFITGKIATRTKDNLT